MGSNRNKSKILGQAALSHLHGKLDDAERMYREFLIQYPDYPDALHLLGMLLFQKGDVQSALPLIEKAINRAPNRTAYLINLGIVLRSVGRIDEAIRVNQKALALKPNDAKILFNLGRAFQEKHDWESAKKSYEKVLAINPQHCATHNNLGWALKQQGRLREAHDSFRKAAAIEPENAGIQGNMAGTLKDMGEIEQAIETYGKALELNPLSREICSNFLFALNYDHERTPEELGEEHKRRSSVFGEKNVSSSAIQVSNRDSNRPLRIGYVSADFRIHSVGFFIEPIVDGHAGSLNQFEIYCYSDVAHPDNLTGRVEVSATKFRPIYGKPDSDVKELVARDQIDILVDLAGHTAYNRLGLFARKPAPIQVTYLGYPNTTGLGAIDYRLTDLHTDPLGKTEHLHSEKLARIPECFLLYKPPPSCPRVGEAPCHKDQAVTFGSFNNLSKVSKPVVALWAQVLDTVPGSRLLLKSRPLADQRTRQRVLGLFETHGISSNRIELKGHTESQNAHFELYNRIDIALDTFPYNGTTTTCEALWMGVPVIAMSGERHAGRVGLSILSNVGLPELVASTPEQYVATAVQLTGDHQRLKQYKSRLREQMHRSRLMDIPTFVENLEQVYRTMWEAKVQEEQQAVFDSSTGSTLA